MSNFYQFSNFDKKPNLSFNRVHENEKECQTDTNYSELITRGARSIECEQQILQSQLSIETKERSIIQRENELLERDEELRERKLILEGLERQVAEKQKKLVCEPLVLIGSSDKLSQKIQNEKIQLLKDLYTHNLIPDGDYEKLYTFSQYEDFEEKLIQEPCDFLELKRRIEILKKLENFLLVEYKKFEIANSYINEEYKNISERQRELDYKYSQIHSQIQPNPLDNTQTTKYNSPSNYENSWKDQTVRKALENEEKAEIKGVYEEIIQLKQENRELTLENFKLKEFVEYYQTPSKSSAYDIPSSSKPQIFQNPFGISYGDNEPRIQDFSIEANPKSNPGIPINGVNENYSCYIRELKENLKKSDVIYRWLKITSSRNKDKKNIRLLCAMAMWRVSCIEIRRPFTPNIYLDEKWRKERLQLMKVNRYPFASMSAPRRKMEIQLLELEREEFFRCRILLTLSSVFRNQQRREKTLMACGFLKFALGCFLRKKPIENKDNNFITMFKEVLNYENQKETKAKITNVKPQSKYFNSLNQKNQKPTSQSLDQIPKLISSFTRKLRNQFLNRIRKYFYRIHRFGVNKEFKGIKQEFAEINLVLKNYIEKNDFSMNKSKILMAENDELIQQLLTNSNLH